MQAQEASTRCSLLEAQLRDCQEEKEVLSEQVCDTITPFASTVFCASQLVRVIKPGTPAGCLVYIVGIFVPRV